MGRITVDGKQFAVDGERFRFAGVTYGTFAARDDGALFPDTDRVRSDFAEMAARGFTVVRTYTVPPPDVIDAAEVAGLRILAGVFWPDWRYLTESSRREQRRIADDARTAVRNATFALAGRDTVLGLSLGNEIPADVIRWLGTARVESMLAGLAEVVREVDPDMLVTYANYPTAEYLKLDTLDFVTFNVFLERPNDLRRYLTRLHNIAGDRPVVLGELGLDAGTTPVGEARQAEVIDWQLATAMERGMAGTCVFSWSDDWVVGGNRVEGWHFGLTTAERTPRLAIEPVHVLTSDERAEHVPGCNMAFWRYALERVDGFDPVFVSAGDDVDVCWKVLDAGLEIGFHPAALVWHHRRPTIRTYFRQQRGYGRSEALVESRHPERYTALGTARWHGRIYNPAAPIRGRQTIYRGPFGTAAFQSVYGDGGHGIDVAYQLGGPLAFASLVTLPALPFMWPVAAPGLIGLVFLAYLFGYGMAHADPPRRWAGSKLGFRVTVAALHLAQPLVRLWGRYHRNPMQAPPGTVMPVLPEPVTTLGRRHIMFSAERSRDELATEMVAGMRAEGLRVLPVNSWDEVDATVVASTLVVGELVTSDHPVGFQQLRLQTRLRTGRVAAGLAASVALAVVAWPLAVAAIVAGAVEVGRGWWKIARTAWSAIAGRRRVTATFPGPPATTPPPGPPATPSPAPSDTDRSSSDVLAATPAASTTTPSTAPAPAAPTASAGAWTGFAVEHIDGVDLREPAGSG